MANHSQSDAANNWNWFGDDNNKEQEVARVEDNSVDKNMLFNQLLAKSFLTNFKLYSRVLQHSVLVRLAEPPNIKFEFSITATCESSVRSFALMALKENP